MGYAIVERLVEESNEPLIVILACRNKQRAHEALASLETHFNKQLQHHKKHSTNTEETHQARKHHHPELKVELVDVGSVASVTKFIERIREQYTTIDYLFCNAGVLPSDGIKWPKLVTDLFMRPMDLVTRSDVLVQPKQHLTEDGIGNVLAANVFGHYLMVTLSLFFILQAYSGHIFYVPLADHPFILSPSLCCRLKDWRTN